MDTSLWVLQWILAVFFLGVGAMKLLQPYAKMAEEERMGWVNDVSPPVVRLAGVTEVLAAVALTVPGLADTAELLVPLAAFGLAAQQLIAAVWIHRPRIETQNISVNLALAAVTFIVGIGRLLEPLG